MLENIIDTVEQLRVYLKYEPLYMLSFFPVIFIVFFAMRFVGRKQRSKIATASNPDNMKDLRRHLWLRNMYYIMLGLLILGMVGLFFYQAIMHHLIT